MSVDPVVLGFAFSMGVATFFSPCSVALIPAYVGYFVGLEGPGAKERPTRASLAAGARFGGAAAAGILALLAAAGGLIWLARTRFSLSSERLLETVTGAGYAVGVLLVVLGLLMLAGRGPTVTLPIRAPRERTLLNMAGFGVVFAVASMGCTLPLVFSVIAQAATQGALGGFLTVLAFGAGTAVLMFVVSLALSLGQETARARLRVAMRYAKPASALLLVAAGVYVVYYYATLPG